MEIFLGWLIGCIFFGLITRYVSRCRGYDGGFAWGFFLGIIGLLVVGFRPVRGNAQHYVSASPDTASSRIGKSNDALAAAKNQQKADEESLKPLKFGNEWDGYKTKKDVNSAVFIEPKERKHERYNGSEKLDALKRAHDKGEISDMEYHIQKNKIMEEWQKHILE